MAELFRLYGRPKYGDWVAGTVSREVMADLLAGAVTSPDNGGMLSQDTIILGLAYRRYRNPAPFGVSGRDRLLHLYLIGQTGTGKSVSVG